MYLLVLVALILTIVLPLFAFYVSDKTNRKVKKLLFSNVVSFSVVLLVALTATFSKIQAAEAAGAVGSAVNGLGLIAAALSVGLSGLGGGIAVASSASAAIGALSENEGLMGKALIFVALGEGIALYGLVISFMILGKI